MPSALSSKNEETLICAQAMKLAPFLSASGYCAPIKKGEMLALTNHLMVEVRARAYVHNFNCTQTCTCFAAGDLGAP